MQVARQEAEERLQEAETAVLSHQASMLQLQQQSRAAVSTQPMAHNTDDSSTSEHEAALHNSRGSAEPSSRPEEGLPEGTAAEFLPSGTTLQLTNPLFSQQDLQNPMQMPDAAVDPNPSVAGDQQNNASQSGELAQAGNPSMAGVAEGSSTQTVLQLQQQVQGLRSELDTQASQLQTTEAGKEFVQRLLNAVTAEHNDLRNQLDRKQALKRSASELNYRPSFLTGSASAKASVAEHSPQGLLGLQPMSSQIPAMWLTTPSVRRSLLTEYGPAVKPYARDGQALEGAESLLGSQAADSDLHPSREGDSRLSEQLCLSGKSM